MRSLTIAATGDSLITMHVAHSQGPGFRALLDVLRAIVERLGRLSPTVAIEWQRDGFGAVRGF